MNVIHHILWKRCQIVSNFCYFPSAFVWLLYNIFVINQGDAHICAEYAKLCTKSLSYKCIFLNLLFRILIYIQKVQTPCLITFKN